MSVSVRTKKWLKRAMRDPLAVDEMFQSQDQYVDITFSAAQLNTLNATPLTVLGAPGAGFVHVLTGGLILVDAGATPFELGSGTLDIRYTDGSGTLALKFTNALVESATDANGWAMPEAHVVAVANAVLVAKASADITAGDGQIKLRLFYKKVPTLA